MNEHTEYLIKWLHQVFDDEQKKRAFGGFGVPKPFKNINSCIYGQVIQELQRLSNENENLKQKLHGSNLVSEKPNDVCADEELLQLVQQVNTLLEDLSYKLDNNSNIEFHPLTSEVNCYHGLRQLIPCKIRYPAYIYVKQSEVLSPEKIIM